MRLWPRRPSRSNIGKVDLYTIGVDAAKQQLYARLRASVEQVQRGEAPGGPGFVHIAAHLCEDIVKPDGSREPSEYLQQLVAETPKVVAKKSGPVVEWVLASHRRNEVLDCDVLAQAALAGWKALRRSSSPVDQASSSPTGGSPPASPTQSARSRQKWKRADWPAQGSSEPPRPEGEAKARRAESEPPGPEEPSRYNPRGRKIAPPSWPPR